MDTFLYTTNSLKPNEESRFSQKGVRLYNGDQRIKMRNETGILEITSIRIKWKNEIMTIGLDLGNIVLVEKEIPASKGLFQKTTPKIVVHVQKDNQNQTEGNSPFAPSQLFYFKLGFTEGNIDDFFRKFQLILQEKSWEKVLKPNSAGKFRAGIVGIERQLESQARETSKNISEAFQDVNSLIEKAKPMVKLAQTISSKLKDKQGSSGDDETVKFRQHLLSLGITSDPVTKAKFGSGHVYFEKLGQEICRVLENEIKEKGGMMSLVEAFCYINRARGIELVSPDDLLSACLTMEKQNLPLRVKELGNKIKILQHSTFDEDFYVASTLSTFDTHKSLTPEEYARISGIPLLIAKQSLLITENKGKACRDESIEGLRFYPNLFFD